MSDGKLPALDPDEAAFYYRGALLNLCVMASP